jgi:uroporphyrinogen-III synthase
MNEQSLAGRTIAIPETRELDVFASMLERRGAAVVRCPLVAILDSPHPQEVLAWARRFAAGACDDLILLTGEGLRRLLACIDRHEPAMRETFVVELARVRKLVRGPKPARALRELGLRQDLDADAPTTDGVIATLTRLDLNARRIGVQLYGTDPNTKLIDFLKSRGAEVLPVAPYVYADESADAAVSELVHRMQSGEVDAIAFTSKAQVDRLFKLAAPDALRSAFERTRIAAVGPVVSDTLSERGFRAEFMPSESYFMKPLVRTLEEELGPKPAS